MKNTPFVLTVPPAHVISRLSRIEAHDLSVEQAEKVQQIVCNQWMDSVDYRLKIPAAPFLQGYQADGHRSWVLVEFWSDDEAAKRNFVDYINQQLGLLTRDPNRHVHAIGCFAAFDCNTNRYPLRCGEDSGDKR